MFQKGNAILVIIIILALAAGGWYWYSLSKNQGGDIIGCPQDAKICPDGSAVARTGPNCEFAACPNEDVGSTGSTNAGNTETANWKMYRNEEYGFEVKYPEEWDGKTARLTTTHAGVWFNYEEIGNWSFRFPIWASMGKIEDWVSVYPILSTPEQIFIGENVGKSFIVNSGEGGKMKILIWASNGKLFRTEYGIEGYHFNGNPDAGEKFIISILSTFRFLP